jgi:hypothetical protein
MGVYFAIPLLAVLIGYPAIISWYYSPQPITFFSVFSTMWVLMLVANIYVFHFVGSLKCILITGSLSAVVAGGINVWDEKKQLMQSITNFVSQRPITCLPF